MSQNLAYSLTGCPDLPTVRENKNVVCTTGTACTTGKSTIAQDEKNLAPRFVESKYLPPSSIDSLHNISPFTLLSKDSGNFFGFTVAKTHSRFFVSKCDYKDDTFVCHIRHKDGTKVGSSDWVRYELGKLRRKILVILELIIAQPSRLGWIEFQRQQGTHARLEVDKKERPMRSRERKATRKEMRNKKESRNTLSFQSGVETSIYDSTPTPPIPRTRFNMSQRAKALKAFNSAMEYSREEISRYATGIGLACVRLYRDYQDHTAVARQLGNWQVNFRRKAMTRSVLDFLRVATGSRYTEDLIFKLIGSLMGSFFGHSSNCNELDFQAGGAPNFMRGVNVPLFMMFALPFIDLTRGPKSILSSITAGLNNYHGRGGVSEKAGLFTSVVNWFQWLVETGTQAFEAKSFKPFFHTESSYSNWYTTSKQLITDQPIYLLSVTSNDICKYMDEIADSIQVGKEIVLKLQASSHPLYPFAQRHLDQLIAIDSEKRLHEKARRTKKIPFAMGIYGAPSCGKTTLLEELIVIYCKITGVDYDPGKKYVRSASDKFSSGLRSDMKYFIIDDIGSVSSQVSGEKAADSVISFMEYFNTASSATNQAALDDKGKIYARPDIVFLTTNDAKFGTAGVCVTPAAFFRRVGFRLSINVKPEFRPTPDSNSVDTSKVAMADTRDIHTYTVVKYVITQGEGEIHTVRDRVIDASNDNSTVSEVIILNSVGPQEFFKWYSIAIRAHVKNSNYLQSTDSILVTADFCEECCMLSIRCQCVPDLDPHSLPKPPYFPDRKLREYGHSYCTDSDISDPGRYEEPQSEFDIHLEVQGGACSRRAAVMRTDMLESFKAAGRAMVDWGNFMKAFKVFVFQEYENLSELRRIFSLFFTLWITTAADQAYDFTPSIQQPPQQKAKRPWFFSAPPAPSASAELQNKSISLTHQSSAYKDWLDNVKSDSEGDVENIYQAKPLDTWVRLRGYCETLDIHALATKVARNMLWFKLYEKEGDSTHTTVHGLGLHRDFVLIPYHAVATNLWIVWVDNGCERKAYIPDVISGLTVEEDLAVLKLPKGRQFKSLLNYIPVSYAGVGTVDHSYFVTIKSNRPTGPIKTLDIPLMMEDGGVRQSVGYHENMGDGSCGSVVLSAIGNRVFIHGMHVLGKEKPAIGFSSRFDLITALGGNLGLMNRIATVPTRRLENNGLSLAKNRPYSEGVFHSRSYVTYKQKHEPSFVWPPHMIPLGTIDFGSTKPSSKIVPTILHGFVEDSIKQPPNMFVGTKNGVYYNPYNDGIDDLMHQYHIPLDILNSSFTTLNTRYTKLFKLAPKAHPLKEFESLNGVDGVRFLDAFKRTTGQGLPNRGTKAEHIVDDPSGRYYTPRARNSVRVVLEALMRHENPGIFCDFSLKDEVQKPGKAIRVFTQLPFAFNDIMRRIFLPVFKIIQDNPLLFGSSVGMNADSFQWKQLYVKHIRMKYHTLYDFKKFDKSHHVDMMRLVCMLLFSMASQIFSVNAEVEEFPWQAIAASGLSIICHPIYNVCGTIIQLMGSLASGAFLTVVLNGLAQEMIMQSFWLRFTPTFRIAKPISNRGTDWFMIYCVLDRYGDDGFVSSMVPGFNLSFFIKTGATWDLIITAPDKSDVIPDTFPVEKWNYLKRGFHLEDDGNVYAVLEEQSLLKTLNYWVPDKSISLLEAMTRRCNEVMEYLAYLPEDRCSLISSQMHTGMCAKFGTPAVGFYFRTREEVRALRLDGYTPHLFAKCNFASKHKMDPVTYYETIYPLPTTEQLTLLTNVE